MLAFNLINQTTPSIAVAQSAVADILNTNEPVVLVVDRIITEVARYYGISADDIKSKKRTSNITMARQVSMYIIREVCQLSLPLIGEEFDGRDHSTVHHSIRKVEHDGDKLLFPERCQRHYPHRKREITRLFPARRICFPHFPQSYSTQRRQNIWKNWTFDRVFHFLSVLVLSFPLFPRVFPGQKRGCPHPRILSQQRLNRRAVSGRGPVRTEKPGVSTDSKAPITTTISFYLYFAE